MAGSDTWTMHKGQDWIQPFQMDPVEDITGWTIKLWIFTATEIEKTVAVTAGAAGTMQATLADTDTDGKAAGTYGYEVWRTDTGFERLLAKGLFLLQDVSRDVT